MSPRYRLLLDDLVAETDAFDGVLDTVDDAGLDRASAAEGWSIRDQVSHLAGFDEAGLRAATDPEGFLIDLEQRLSEGNDPIEEYRQRGAAMSGLELRRWWQESRDSLLDALGRLDPQTRVPWYGPPMSAMSHATARLMETWAHGLDVRDVTGFEPAASERLRHVAHIGIGARGFSFVNRGLEPPTEPILVALRGPSGDEWTWGPADAVDQVRAPALDFCLHVTQRRHRSEVTIETSGPVATAWMDIAQAFAGPPGLG